MLHRGEGRNFVKSAGLARETMRPQFFFFLRVFPSYFFFLSAALTWQDTKITPLAVRRGLFKSTLTHKCAIQLTLPY